MKYNKRHDSSDMFENIFFILYTKSNCLGSILIHFISFTRSIAMARELQLILTQMIHTSTKHSVQLDGVK